MANLIRRHTLQALYPQNDSFDQIQTVWKLTQNKQQNLNSTKCAYVPVVCTQICKLLREIRREKNMKI